MKNRFKFRAWSKELNKMFNHVLVNSEGLYEFACNTENGKVSSYAGTNYKHGYAGTNYKHDCLLMQCTGLKDKNGRLIYEGDVLSTDESLFLKLIKRGVIIYDIKNAAYTLAYKLEESDIFIYSENNVFICNEERFSYYEIIGNIYENPELIEKCK
jgi:uncharacterized phage protein (TIGR01671 family)